jgi:hypothetical protein
MRLLSIVGRCGRWLCRLRRLRDYQTLHTIKIHGAPDAALLPCVAARVAERPSFGFLANLKPVDGLEQ